MRGETGTGEVGDFVLGETGAGEDFDGGFVHGGDGVVGWDEFGVVTSAASDEFAAETGVFVDLQHIDAGVGNGGFEQDVEGFAPGGERLASEASQQIDVEVGDADLAQALQIAEDIGAGVQASADGALAVEEALDAEADAVDAAFGKGLQGLIGELSGSAFDGDFGVGGEYEFLADGAEDGVKVSRREQNGRAPAEVNGVNDAGQMDPERVSAGVAVMEVFDESLDVATVLAGGIDAGGEVAVRAFGAAEGDGEVESDRDILIRRGELRCGLHLKTVSHCRSGSVRSGKRCGHPVQSKKEADSSL